MLNDSNGWKAIIANSVQVLQKTAEDLRVAGQASKDGIEKMFDGLESCRKIQSVYGEHLAEILIEQKEINKKVDEEINGEKGLYTAVSVQNESIKNLVDTVKDLKSIFLTFIVFVFTTGLGYILARMFKFVP